MFKWHLTFSVASVVLSFAAHAQSAPTAETPAQPAPISGAADFSDIRRARIVNHIGNEIGVLDDVVVDGDGRIVHLIVAHGGVLGLGEFKRRMDAGALPPITGGKIVLTGLTTDAIAALPEYVEATMTPIADDPDPPVSGANQTASQNATTHIPVAPAVVRRKPVAPGRQVTASPPDNTRATTLVETADRSSEGMAPQEGTGTSPTLINPKAFEAMGEQNRNLNASDAMLTAGYAREYVPPNLPVSGDATVAIPSLGENSVSDLTNWVTSSVGRSRDSDRARWRVGRVVGTQLRGLDSGSSVKEVRLAGGRIAGILVARGNAKNSTREIAFEHLNIGGASLRPQIALTRQK